MPYIDVMYHGKVPRPGFPNRDAQGAGGGPRRPHAAEEAGATAEPEAARPPHDFTGISLQRTMQ